MPLLYYWRGHNYYRDLDMGAGYHLNQANPLLHQTELGDSLWAFTRNSAGSYVLAAELVVRARTINPPGFRYGRYRLWGDLRRSRYFMVDNQDSAEAVLRGLSISAKASVLGQAFQGNAAVRRINQHDHQLLSVATRDLPLEPRSRLLPEEQLEATLLLGEPALIAALIGSEASGLASRRREYLAQEAPARNRQLVRRLQELYAGRCQLCLWDPGAEYGERLCHAHHIQWLSRGGEDSIENMMLICPNHHSAIHGCDAPFDFSDLAFDFGARREVLQLDQHLGAGR